MPTQGTQQTGSGPARGLLGRGAGSCSAAAPGRFSAEPQPNPPHPHLLRTSPPWIGSRPAGKGTEASGDPFRSDHLLHLLWDAMGWHGMALTRKYSWA